MIVAYEENEEIKISEFPGASAEGPRPLLRIKHAKRILEAARKLRPEVKWVISGAGPYRVCDIDSAQ